MPYREPAPPEDPRRLPLLESVTVRSPCKQPWDAMVGDERRRLCLHCSKTVHDLTAMGAEEVEAFLERHLDASPCVRLYRRPDGRVLTSECAPGSRARHQRRVTVALAGVTLAGAIGATMVPDPCVADDERPVTTAERLTLELPTSYRWHIGELEAEVVMGELEQEP